MFAQKIHGIKAKLYNKQRYKEKAALRKKLKVKAEKDVEHEMEPRDDSLPHYLLDRNETARSKVLSNTLKQMRKEKAVFFFFLFLLFKT
jgi:ribosome biogenesis protein NSA2